MNEEKILDSGLMEEEIEEAAKLIRFGIYIIDTLGFFFIIFLHAMILDGMLGIIPEDGSPFLGIYFFVLYVVYYLGFEFFFNKTPGKFLTNTRVTNLFGGRPTFTELLKRNLFRLLPFDSLSFLIFKRGWHDELSKTYVVRG